MLTATLRGYKVSVLTHAYEHKPLRKIAMATCNHQADSPLYVWSDVQFSDLQTLNGVQPRCH